MDQKELWDRGWQAIDSRLPATGFARRVHRFLKDKHVKTMLDLGAGDGKDSLYFSARGFDVTAVDFSREAIRKLEHEISRRKIENLRAVVLDIRDLDQDSSYDVIYANLSLHYFDDRETSGIFSALHRLLAPGGYLFVRCKSVDDPSYGIGEEIGRDLFCNQGKTVHLFSKEYLREKLSRYSVQSIRRTSSRHKTMDRGVVDCRFVEAIAQK